MSSSIKAIIGLGNPNTQFVHTRHNIGFRVINALAEKHGGIWHTQQNFEKISVTINDQPILFIKPQTYMNRSGEVIPYLKKQGVQAKNILVIHDELEKSFGNISIKHGGSARGHNGLRSIIQFIGPDFTRLRFGIGRPEHKEDVAQYVLENFSESFKDVENAIQNAVTLIEKYIQNTK